MANSGLLIVDKPQGVTSHDIVAAVRGALHMKRVGHAGTLDPMATGALIVGFGNATRLLNVIVAETDGAAQLLKPLAFGLVDRTGKAIGRPHLESFAGREITIESSGDVPLEIDGEVVPGTVRSYTARVLPGAVRIVVDSLSPYGSEDDGSSRFGESEVIAYPE